MGCNLRRPNLNRDFFKGRFFTKTEIYLSEADSDATDESFSVDQRSSSVVAAGSAVSEIFILGDHDCVSPHFGRLFAKFVLDKITVHPGFGPYPYVAQLDVTSFGTALDEHHMIGMGFGEMRSTGIKPGADIRPA